MAVSQQMIGNPNQWFTTFWIIWLLAFLPVEIWALITKSRGDTFSEHVWHWFKVMDDRPTAWTWLWRVPLLVFLVWLTGHLVFGWWTVWEWPTW
jgi:hypothetical protein